MEWSPTRREFVSASATGTGLSATNATDVIPDRPLVPTADVQWKRDVGDTVIPLEVTGNLVYAVTDDGAVLALSTDGIERWRYEVETSGRDSYPSVVLHAESAYVSDDGSVVALDAQDGSVEWRFDGDSHAYARSATAGIVFVYDDGLVALSSADGSERWRFVPENGGVWFEPYHGTERFYVGTTGGELYALDERDGSVDWTTQFPEEGDNEYETEYPHLTPFAEVDDLVLAWNSGEGTLFGVDAETGERRWRTETTNDSYAFPGVRRDDTLYVNDGSFLRAIAAADGREQWRFEAEGEVSWQLRMFDGILYAGGKGFVSAVSLDGTEQWQFDAGGNFDAGEQKVAYVAGQLGDAVVVHSHKAATYALDPADGRPRWRFSSPENSTWVPRVTDDTLYLGSESGIVYAVTAPGSTPLYDALRTAVSPAGLVTGGLFAGALLAGTYRRRKRARAPPPPPERFEDFEIDRRLGGTDSAEDVLGEADSSEGVLGENALAKADTDYVEEYEARTPKGERVALKRLESDAIDSDRFSEAVETWADLDVPGVLEVRWWGTDPVPWVATELPDASLAERSDEFAFGELVRTVADAAEMVHQAHREGVVHGRLAPENVLFVDGDVRIGDWRLEAELRGPPENCESDAPGNDDTLEAETPQADTAEADTVQLAAMVADLLAGEQVGDDLGDNLTNFDADLTNFDADLTKVLARALADDPTERYESALKFADALRWAVRD